MLIPLTPHDVSYCSGGTRLVISPHETRSRDEIISGLLGFYSLSEDADLSTCKTAAGKPYFRSLPLCLSTTDSGPYDVLALSTEEIGIDLQIHKNMKYLSLAKRFFHPDEYKYLSSLPSNYQPDVFFLLWTAKEAYVKYTGTGIDQNFSRFSVFSVPEYISSIQIDGRMTLSVCQKKPLPLLF
ncbi:MAG: 4'-phosphopantetheinyl transferase superfamily protein [Firmicutes bacterium]|nr:4'-phosphopantetheinyl transferase superfamily protein [Bacillota bacterium]